MTLKCPDCGAPLREGLDLMREEWWCSGCGRFFGDKSEITMKRQERLIKLSNEFKDKFIETYPAVGVVSVIGSPESNESQTEGLYRLIAKCHRQGEYIKQLQTTIYITFAVAVLFWLLWLWGPR